MTIPNLHPPAVGAPSAGLRYQVRYFWQKAIPMLYPNALVQKVVVEHKGVEAVDDVVVYYAAPGAFDRRTYAKTTADFHQVKFHTALTGSVNEEALRDPAWTGTKDSLLKRFADAWKALRVEHPNVRLHLITNWPWHPDCPLAPLIRDGRLSEKFFEQGPASAVGRIRASWQAVCGLDDSEFCAFARAFCFSTSAASQADADERLGDHCRAAGLIPPDPGVNWSAYDDLGKRLIEDGRLEFTAASLRELVQEQKLVAKDQPGFNSTFAVRSFSFQAYVPETEGACPVDLTSYFNGRAPIDEGVWSGGVRECLDGAMPFVAKLQAPVQVALDAHISIAWYVGHLLNPKSGIPILLRQRTKNRPPALWDVSQPLRPSNAEEWMPTAPQCVGDGRELAVIVSVTHTALEDARRTIDAVPAIGNVLHFSVPKPGSYAIQDGGHARWLADELVSVAHGAVAKLAPSRVHLFLACPASLAFLLGQEALSLGPTTAYEFPFGHPSRAYRPGMSI
jgi:hypothetical protein